MRTSYLSQIDKLVKNALMQDQSWHAAFNTSEELPSLISRTQSDPSFNLVIIKIKWE